MESLGSVVFNLFVIFTWGAGAVGLKRIGAAESKLKVVTPGTVVAPPQPAIPSLSPGHDQRERIAIAV